MPLSPPPTRRTGRRADLAAAAVALALVAAALHGRWLMQPPGDPLTEWPILGLWSPHAGIGTALAPLVAVAAVAWGPALAVRLPWRRALAATYGLALAWTFALVLIDGWRRGAAEKLTSVHEYLTVVPGITDIPAMLRAFADRILDHQPDSWITHVSGHPPAATLTFVWLDRLGLGGGTWAALLCVLVGASAAVAVPVTLRVLGDEDRARAVLPFLALFPGALWVGVSADAVFTGVTAWGIALLAVSGRALKNGDRWAPAGCFLAGAVLGYGIFLSYGLVLMGAVAVAVLVVLRSAKALAWAVPGAVAVVGVFALAGFWWLEGYQLVVERYYQGIANRRPYEFWIWANLACLVFTVGPAVAAGLRRARDPRLAATALVWGAAAAILAANLSGLSKAEVERIWLPFAVWLAVAAACLPRRDHRRWLAAQAVLPLVVDHLLVMNW